MLDHEFERIVFEPNKGLLELMKRRRTAKMAMRRAQELYRLGHYLKLCRQAHDFRWYHQVPALLPVFIGYSLAGILALAALVAWIMYFFSTLITVSLGSLLGATFSALGTAVLLGRWGWLKYDVLSAKESEQGYVAEDGRCSFFARLWTEVQAWNREVPRLKYLCRQLRRGQVTQEEVRWHLEQARRRRDTLRLELRLAEEQIAEEGELGTYEGPSLDPRSVKDHYGLRPSEAPTQVPRERQQNPPLALADNQVEDLNDAWFDQEGNNDLEVVVVASDRRRV